MADLTITAANVKPVTVNSPKTGTLGATLTAGEPVYLDGSNKLQAALADTAVHSACVGILLTGGSNGQLAFYAGTPGDIIAIGATVVVGERYDLSINSGKIAPVGDQATGNWVVELGYSQPGSTVNIILTMLSLNEQHA